MPTRPEAMAVISEILEMPTGRVHESDDLEDLGWDSLADLGFMAAADERWGIAVDPRRLAARRAPADLVALLGV